MARSLVLTAIAVTMGLAGAAHRANASAVEGPPAMQCAALARVDFSDIVDAPTQVTSADPIAPKDGVPAYCEVKGYVAPSVEIHVALPVSWNGKLIELGSVGEINNDACYSVLRKGYACVTSDMGMRTDLSFYNNLQAKVDNGFRAAHVVALAGKAFTEKYYSQRLQKSYFGGCSVGGRQALVEAQRFPWDFDGIIAGAPPVNQTMIYTNLAWASRAIHDGEGHALLRIRDLQLLKGAAVAKCDLDDGVKDGVIGNPLHCSFDPTDLLCKKDEARDCLTPEQVAAAKKIYSGPVTTGGMKLLPGGPLPGSEQANVDWGFAGWDDVYGDRMVSTVTSGFRYLFFMPEPGPTWTLKDFDFDRDYKRLALVEALYDSGDPDLRKFKAAGGKMIVYQGLNDPAVLPRSTIDYYETVERTMNGREATQSFFRLFVLPGMDHCGFGDGAYAVDWLSALESWVEKGQAPDKLISSHVRLDDLRFPDDFATLERRIEFPLDPAMIQFTRPVYPYPTRAKYKGSGNSNDAANFVPVNE
jgi:Tannase and feruloyl esterase